MNAPKSAPQHLASGRPAQRDDLVLARRYRLVRPHLPAAGGTLLDFGCGNGAQTACFAPHFQRVVGIDVNSGNLRGLADEWRDRALTQAVLGLCYDGTRLPIRDASIDCCISFEVLEHVVDESLALRELRRVLKPGGMLAISVPNRWWIFETHGADLPLLPWNRVPLFSWLPRRLHDRWARARIYRRREIRALLSAAGFSVLRDCYVTAPMDVVKWRPLQRLLRAWAFGRDSTSVPILATSSLVIATVT